MGLSHPYANTEIKHDIMSDLLCPAGSSVKSKLNLHIRWNTWCLKQKD